MEYRVIRLAGLSFIFIAALAGCAGAPSTGPAAQGSAAAASPLELARSEIAQARASGYDVEDALIFLRRAEQAVAVGDEKMANAAAEQARRAVEARKAIDGARPEVEKAMREAGPVASDAGKLLDAAEAALKAGDPVRALELAAQARRQAAEAVEQHRSQVASFAAEKAARYQVVRGDSLWAISGKSRVYGDPLLWPLLFKANQQQIKDADLIYPGQELAVERNVPAGERQSAARHARTRGPWKRGVREPSDKTWLGR